MKEKLCTRKVLFGFLLFLLICSAIFIFYYLNLDHYYGQFIGIISNDEKSQIVVCDIETGTFAVIKDLEPSEYIEYATVNNQGTKIAYTKWNDTLNNQYLIIESGLGRKITYGKFEDTQKFSTIRTPMFIHDGKDLICIHAGKKDGYPIEKLVLFNLNNKDEQTIDSGELILISTDEDDNYDHETSTAMRAEVDGELETHITDQIELDRLLEKYQARQIKIKDAGTRLFVQYSRPAFDAKNGRIIYAKSLYRNMARQGEGVILSSGIWTYDIVSGEKQFIYAAEDNCLIGKIDIKPDGSAIVFSESMHTGENGRIMELPLDATGEMKCLVKPNEEHYANLDPMYVDNQHITYLSIAKDESLENAVRYVFDLQNASTKKITLEYKNKPELIKFFNRIY